MVLTVLWFFRKYDIPAGQYVGRDVFEFHAKVHDWHADVIIVGIPRCVEYGWLAVDFSGGAAITQLGLDQRAPSALSPGDLAAMAALYPNAVRFAQGEAQPSRSSLMGK